MNDAQFYRPTINDGIESHLFSVIEYFSQSDITWPFFPPTEKMQLALQHSD